MRTDKCVRGECGGNESNTDRELYVSLCVGVHTIQGKSRSQTSFRYLMGRTSRPKVAMTRPSPPPLPAAPCSPRSRHPHWGEGKKR